MIDMKQIKENVSSKIKTYQTQEETESLPKDNRHMPRKTETSEGSASIGASIRIKGDVTADENLIIQGEVDGTITVHGHNVTISRTGRVKANLEAKQIVVEGQLQGDLNGDEKVIIRETGNVQGNIISPRVTLEDGALFKGSIEMEPRSISGKQQKSGVNAIHDNDKSEIKLA